MAAEKKNKEGHAVGACRNALYWLRKRLVGVAFAKSSQRAVLFFGTIPWADIYRYIKRCTAIRFIFVFLLECIPEEPCVCVHCLLYTNIYIYIMTIRQHSLLTPVKTPVPREHAYLLTHSFIKRREKKSGKK